MDFWFDFSSPYGYLAARDASTRIAAQSRPRGATGVRSCSASMFQATGGAPLTEMPIKGDYSKHDFARSARFLGVPVPHAQPLSRCHAERRPRLPAG
ncbi:MAG: DsbA family protein [Comamonadaceae bacterium]|nr:DsbA family protein [Comamonadaceae bacterium]